MPSSKPEPYLLVESVLYVHGPDEIPGAEDADVTILFEAIRGERHPWVRDHLDEELPQKGEMAYLSIDFEKGGLGAPPDADRLPPVESEEDYGKTLKAYADSAVAFLKEHTDEIVDFLRDRARQKGIP